MKITILTLFPDMFSGFLQESIVKKAQEKGELELEIVDVREFAVDDYGTVDDRPYGGGAGMVLMAKPILDALQKHDPNHKAHRIMTSPRGNLFNQKKAKALSSEEHLVIIAGRYEAIDERALEQIDEEVSIGDVVLTGGELPAAVITDAVARLLPNVLKKEDAAENESFQEVSVAKLHTLLPDDDYVQNLVKKGAKTVQLLEHAHYTRPQTVNGTDVPDVLLSGDHAEIEKWRLVQAFERTKEDRPDLLKQPSESK